MSSRSARSHRLMDRGRMIAIVAPLLSSIASAQLPPSVDITLVNVGTVDSLEVRVRSNGTSFDELVTGLTFTVAWPAASQATMGGTTLPCYDGVPIAPSPQVDDGAWHYVTYNAFALQLLDEACPLNTWPADAWVPVMKVKVNDLVGCVPFAIVNDPFTGANNRDYFISLNGEEVTGSIQGDPVDVGQCPGDPDCLGVPDGPALPGTACDDGDQCTENDTWGPECVCTGVFVDTDADGTCDAEDGCAEDPLKTEPGICGCGVADTDTDADGTADCVDGCPEDPLKTEPGICGCGVADTDTDADGTADCLDGCPDDPLKTEPGICGCGVADSDTDGDGIADCDDPCPLLAELENGDPCDDGNEDTINDTVVNCECVGEPEYDCLGVPGGPALPGTSCDDEDVCTINDVFDVDCVCAGAFEDSDADGTCDASDGCPLDPEKIEPGQCGCGVADTDTDTDGTADCVDSCPEDPLKTEPGVCGCGVVDMDTDADGMADCVDACPEVPGTTGSPCDDGDPGTVNDVLDASCVCHGVPQNDDCDDAVTLQVQAPADCPANATMADNTWATSSGAPPSCAPDGVVGDLWYAFNAGDNVDVTIDLSPGTMIGHGVAVYTACEGVELHCESAPTGPFSMAVSPNSAYLIRVFTDLASGQTGTFDICVSAGVNTAVQAWSGTDGGVLPNPNDGRFRVWNPGPGTVATLRLADMAGRTIRTTQERAAADGYFAVDVSGVAPGVYTIEVEAGGHTVAERVVVR